MTLHKSINLLRGLLLSSVLLFSLCPAGALQAKTFWDSQAVLKDQAIQEQFNEKSAPQDIRVTIAKVIKFLFGFIGIIFVVMIMMSGFRVMTAGGDAKVLADAKKTFVNLCIGFALIVAAYALTDFIMEALLEVATDGY
jgi:hypothetical protein